MSNNNGSKPAAPFTNKPEYQHQECGLTKREHFAILIMQSLVTTHPDIDGYGSSLKARIYKSAVSISDDLLAELEESK